jgi:hypothetical protein
MRVPGPDVWPWKERRGEGSGGWGVGQRWGVPRDGRFSGVGQCPQVCTQMCVNVCVYDAYQVVCANVCVRV